MPSPEDAYVSTMRGLVKRQRDVIHHATSEEDVRQLQRPQEMPDPVEDIQTKQSLGRPLSYQRHFKAKTSTPRHG